MTWATAVKLVLVGTMAALLSCSPENNDVDPHAHHQMADAGEPTELSLYSLDGSWVDQAGTSRPLSSLGGRVQLVSMVYTHCTFSCPRIMADMKRIEGELPTELQGRVGFVLVSIDPERDTPGRLAYFAESSRLDLERWTLLSGSDGQVRELAALLGVKYRAEPGGEFAHSNIITVLDARGEVAHQRTGIGGDPAAALEAIQRALD